MSIRRLQDAHTSGNSAFAFNWKGYTGAYFARLRQQLAPLAKLNRVVKLSKQEREHLGQTAWAPMRHRFFVNGETCLTIVAYCQTTLDYCQTIRTHCPNPENCVSIETPFTSHPTAPNLETIHPSDSQTNRLASQLFKTDKRSK